MRFRKVRAGLYRSEDGKWTVERDVQEYVRQEDADGDGLLAGCQDDGWALVNGETVVDWFDTKRQAVTAAVQMEKRNE